MCGVRCAMCRHIVHFGVRSTMLSLTRCQLSFFLLLLSVYSSMLSQIDGRGKCISKIENVEFTRTKCAARWTWARIRVCVWWIAHRSRFISHSPLDLGLFIHSHSMLSPVSCVNWVLRGFHLRSFGLQIWLRSGLVVLLSSSLWLQQLWCIENLGIDWKPCDYISWICFFSSTLSRMSSTLLANPSTILWLQHTRLPSQCWRLCYPKTSQKSDVHTALRAHVSTFSEFNCKFWQYSKCIPCSRFSV